MRYKTGATAEKNEEMKKEYEILKVKLVKAEEEVKAFEKKYNGKNSQIKVQHIADNMEKKYRELIDKAIVDKKLLSVELALVHKRVINTPVEKSEIKNILNNYQTDINFAKANLDKKEVLFASFKNLLTKEHLTDTSLNKMSGGRYFIVLKEYSKLANEYNDLNKKIDNLKFYEIVKKSELNNQRKEIKSKLDTLESEYKGIIALKNSPEYEKVYNSIKSDREKIVTGINSEVKEFKSNLFENKEKKSIASDIERDISYVQKDTLKAKDYEPQPEFYNFDNEEPQGGGGGGFKILDEDEERWKEKQTNVFERGFSL